MFDLLKRLFKGSPRAPVCQYCGGGLAEVSADEARNNIVGRKCYRCGNCGRHSWLD